MPPHKFVIVKQDLNLCREQAQTVSDDGQDSEIENPNRYHSPQERGSQELMQN